MDTVMAFHWIKFANNITGLSQKHNFESNVTNSSHRAKNSFVDKRALK